MSTSSLVVLGLIAGFTIFLGLPLARIERPMPGLRAFLNAFAVGVLVFLLFDILAHANELVEEALTEASDGSGTWGRFAGLAFLFGAGVAIGLLGLVYYERRLAADSPTRSGPGAAITGVRSAGWIGRLGEAERLSVQIAIGIGLHNFAEGLAIGQSAANDEISLALALVIGFALHNATEGFGIVAPLAAEGIRPSWSFLIVLGVIGGGPTFVGTLVGNAFANDALAVAFLALAAGSVLYVVIQLVQMAAKLGYRELFMWGIFLGLVAGFGTDYVLVLTGS
jgi:ZIP family zinc transporter